LSCCITGWPRARRRLPWTFPAPAIPRVTLSACLSFSTTINIDRSFVQGLHENTARSICRCGRSRRSLMELCTTATAKCGETSEPKLTRLHPKAPHRMQCTCSDKPLGPQPEIERLVPVLREPRKGSARHRPALGAVPVSRTRAAFVTLLRRCSGDPSWAPRCE